jgi:hypothetical protein
MDRQTKYLLVGTTLAVLILTGGYATSVYDNSQLSSLVEKCKSEAAQAPNGKGLVCDPNILTKLVGDDDAGIQKQIVESLSTSGRSFNDAKVIALFVFLLFSSPYAWYFLLRRLREVRDAVTGK